MVPWLVPTTVPLMTSLTGLEMLEVGAVVVGKGKVNGGMGRRSAMRG